MLCHQTCLATLNSGLTPDRRADPGKVALALLKFILNVIIDRWWWRAVSAQVPLSDQEPEELVECKLQRVGTTISVARWQNLIPSFPWIAPGWRVGGAIQGKEGIKFCSAA